MITFNIEEEEDENQFIVCQIKVCAASYNNKPTYNSQCPVTDYYSFSVTGYQAWFWNETFPLFINIELWLLFAQFLIA